MKNIYKNVSVKVMIRLFESWFDWSRDQLERLNYFYCIFDRNSMLNHTELKNENRSKWVQQTLKSKHVSICVSSTIKRRYQTSVRSWVKLKNNKTELWRKFKADFSMNCEIESSTRRVENESCFDKILLRLTSVAQRSFKSSLWKKRFV